MMQTALAISSEKYGFLAEIATDIAQSNTGYELFKKLKNVTDTYDYSYFVLLQRRQFRASDGKKPECAMLTNWNPEFLHQGIAMDIFRHSPIFAANFDVPAPRVGRLDLPPPPGESRRGREANELLVAGGHCSFACFPTCFPSAHHLLVGFTGERQAPSLREQMEMQYLSARVCEAFVRINPHRDTTENPLSSREQCCLRSAADGMSNGETARQLGISEHTVAYHLSSAIRKLSCRNKIHAVAHAYRRGWLE
jgi:DNA-binding CsgD family transcriptional regulator